MILSLLLLLIIVSLIAEMLVMRRCRGALRIRIHVGGTRGKTSVTRYIAAGLRAAGVRTCAKVTGTRAATVDPEGHDLPIVRQGSPRVQEQFKIIRWAAREKAESLVIECMSIAPELQRLESRVLRPHLLVLTNIRDDHREHLGDGSEQVAAMCESIPDDSVVLTDDRDHERTIRRVAENRKSKVIVLSDNEIDPALALPGGAHEANVALALRACREVGVDPNLALAGILSEAAANAQTMVELNLAERHAWFVNGFAVNDIESAREFIDYWRIQLPEPAELVILLNTRADRPLRSRSFAKWLPDLDGLVRVILMGDHSAWTSRALKRYGLPADKIRLWSERQIEQPLADLREMTVDNGLVVGLGNIRGDGLLVAEALER